MLENTPENPEPMMPGIFSSGSPTTTARTSDVPISERNGWMWNFEIATIIKMIARQNTMSSGMPVIIHTSLVSTKKNE